MLINSILLLILVVLCFGGVVLFKTKLGEAGLYAWIVIATVISNITAASIGPMFGLHGVTLANVPFATVFLATNILEIYYGHEQSKKGVYVEVTSAILFVVLMMCCSYLQAEPYDTVTMYLANLFAFGSYYVCNTAASITTFFIANLANVKLFSFLKQHFKGRRLEICSAGSSMICNCIENFVFVILGLFILPNVAFKYNLGIELEQLIPLRDCMTVAVTTCIFEAVISLLNAPTLKLMDRFSK